jgi:hypothetical protein
LLAYSELASQDFDSKSLRALVDQGLCPLNHFSHSRRKHPRNSIILASSQAVWWIPLFHWHLWAAVGFTREHTWLEAV